MNVCSRLWSPGSVIVVVALAGGLTGCGALGLADGPSAPPAPAPVLVPSAPPSANSQPAEALPAFSPAEERYIAQLRPIHNRVRNETLAIAGASLELRSGRMSGAEYRQLLDEARRTYQEAQTAVARLDAPPSLKALNDEYLGAIDQYLGAVTMLEPAAEGDVQRLLAAVPSLRAGNASARHVALALWADEYVPN